MVYGYRAAGGRYLIIGWTFIAALAAALLVAWITLVNLLYLLLQIAMAVDGVGLGDAVRAAARFVRDRSFAIWRVCSSSCSAWSWPRRSRPRWPGPASA